jgi:uncharacterized protein
MKRVNHILNDQQYRLYLLKNKALEEYRQFCNHNFEHMLTVSRLTYLLLLENSCGIISKELAYAAGLLHDIGRWKEYQDGTDHAEYSALLAGPILEQAGFEPAELNLIVKAIAQHRDKGSKGAHRSPLSEALSQADSLSRLCFQCSAVKGCKCPDKRPHYKELNY